MPHLFQASAIGPLGLRNRLVKSATRENLADPAGRPTAASLNFYRRLAQGGAGLIVTGDAYVNCDGQSAPQQNGAHNREAIAAWRPMLEAVHEAGAALALQLTHGGRQTKPSVLGGRPAMAPSAVPNLMYFHRPRTMTGADIRRTITDFGRAAAQAREAGFDAVQIHAAHGYLIAGFLSPLTNRRRDEWGGDAAGRRRFLEAVYQAVRSAVGDDFALLCELNADDHVGMGITPRESFAAARRLAALGLDAVELSSGIFETGIYICRGRMAVDLMGRDRHPLARLWLRLAAAGQQPWVRFRENYHRPYARALKPQLPIPLILVGGIRRRTAAEALLQDGSADFVALARPLIREPGLPARWQAGRQEASACINCNRCLGAMEQGAPLRCYAGRGGSRTLAV